MDSNLKAKVREWLPPPILRWLRRGTSGGNRYEGDFSSWEEASALCTGYDAEEILAKVLRSTLKVKRGEAVYERDSVVFDKAEYAWPVVAGLMWSAARAGGILNVLDFGGALGSSYFQYKSMLHRLPQIRWNVIEQDHYVRVGKQYVEDGQLRFYSSIDECLVECTPNVILLSSVLQYLRDPALTIKSISTAGADCLLLDRTPFIDEGEDRLVIQRVSPSIYRASYPMWVFSTRKFMEALDPEWSLIASHSSPEGIVEASKFEFCFRGHFFESTTKGSEPVSAVSS